eukprot:TRINITY_DN888_c0_g1_i1.p8 TRINITY_DN888_c0_g1~~TRINITY_DN888_c0_g1_i1.p8  ORF type:complete len:105 (+),score=0.81 TRINITY_DN888_c0_g1_i1:999-1313(+)
MGCYEEVFVLEFGFSKIDSGFVCFCFALQLYNFKFQTLYFISKAFLQHLMCRNNFCSASNLYCIYNNWSNEKQNNQIQFGTTNRKIFSNLKKMDLYDKGYTVYF